MSADQATRKSLIYWNYFAFSGMVATAFSSSILLVDRFTLLTWSHLAAKSFVRCAIMVWCGGGANNVSADRSDVPTVSLPFCQWSKKQMEEGWELVMGMFRIAVHFDNEHFTILSPFEMILSPEKVHYSHKTSSKGLNYILESKIF